MNKQLLPLAVLSVREEDALTGITRFQKEVFLAQREALTIRPYSFRPGSYGPFSYSVHRDINILVDNGLIETDARPADDSYDNNYYLYKITDDGKLAANRAEKSDRAPDLQTHLKEVMPTYHQMGLWELLEYTIEEYPKLVEESNIPV